MRRIITVVIITTAGLVTLFGIAVLVVNVAVLPRVVSAVVPRVEEAFDCEIDIDRALYVPFRSIVLRGTSMDFTNRGLRSTVNDGADAPVASGKSYASPRITIDRTRIVMPISVVRGITVAGFDYPGIAGVDPRYPVGSFRKLIAPIRSFGPLPDRVSLTGVSIDFGDVLPHWRITRNTREGDDGRTDATEEDRSPAEPIDSRRAATIGRRNRIAVARIDIIHQHNESTLSALMSVSRSSRGGVTSGVWAPPLSNRHAAVDGEIEIDYEMETVTGRIDPGGFSLGLPGAAIDDFRIWLAFKTDVHDRLHVAGSVALNGAAFALPAIAEEPVSGLDVEYGFEIIYDPLERINSGDSEASGTGSLRFTRGDLRINDAAIGVRPSLEGLFDDGAIDPVVLGISLRLSESPVQMLLDALPGSVTGPIARTRMSGTLEWDFDLTVPLEEVSDMEWSSDVSLVGFAVHRIHPAVNVYKLNDAFVHTIAYEDTSERRTVRIPEAKHASMRWMLMHSEHTERQIRAMRAEDRRIVDSRPAVTVVGDGESDGTTQSEAARLETVSSEEKPEPDPNYRYVYVDDMSPWIIRAILTAEDGDFFFYGGVNPVTLADAIEINIEAGEILYGASTISMQLVKMLFLQQERIFSRKLQEVFLVYLMEHRVPVSKERILELYINLAEFGPGIFGIYDAARYYFDTDPKDLTAGQAVWLASILPAPRTYHGYFENGRIPDAWFARMIGLYDIMLERGRMTPSEYRKAVSNRPEFDPGDVAAY